MRLSLIFIHLSRKSLVLSSELGDLGLMFGNRRGQASHARILGVHEIEKITIFSIT
jgi:hypothetical protein